MSSPDTQTEFKDKHPIFGVLFSFITPPPPMKVKNIDSGDLIVKFFPIFYFTVK